MLPIRQTNYPYIHRYQMECVVMSVKQVPRIVALAAKVSRLPTFATLLL